VSTLSLFVCAPAGQNSDGSCASGQGSWQNVVIADAFDPMALSGDELSGAFGAGFVVLATGLVIAWAAKQIVLAIKQG
jgi:hypothetical protein